MAEAEMISVERVVTEWGYRLALTRDEADTLFAVLVRVIGTPEDSPRKHTTAVVNALRAVGISDCSIPAHPAQLIDEEATGAGIVFHDYPTGEGHG